jgi:putative Mg2+ transporter-C (MgtC) family protein
MEIPANWLDTIIRLTSATLLAAIIGMDRELRDKPAGLRTHMLVGLGASAFSVFALGLVSDLAEQEGIRLDPLRIVEGVIGGLGFLGAGAIIQSRGDVYGMTTAVGIWIAGAIGVGCGTGNYFAVACTTFIAIICLIPLRILERRLDIRNPSALRNSGASDCDKVNAKGE